MAEGGSGTGGPNPKEVSAVNSVLQQQLAIMNQLKDTIALMSTQMSEFCEISDKCFSSDKWQQVTKSAQKYNTQTKTTTQGTSQLAQKAKDLSTTFSKLAPTIGGLAGGFAGLKQGFASFLAVLKGGLNVIKSAATSIFNLGASVVSAPFKMLKGLISMAGSAPGGDSSLAEAMEDLRKEFGFLGPSSSAITDVAKNMQGFADTGLNAINVFGTAAERIKYMTALAKEMGPQFAANADEFKKNGGALLAYQKGLGLTGEQMGVIGIKAKSMGAEMGTVLNDMTKQALHMGKAFNLDAKTISKDMGKAMSDVGHFGHLTTQQLGSAVVYANKLGVSIDKLTGLMDQFDTFDKAAESTSKLNEQFGTNIDAMELMAAQSPAEKMEMLRKSFQATGKDMSQLSFQERKMIQQQTGLDAATFDAAMSQDAQADILGDINKESKKAEDSTLKQADAMKELAVQIERVVKTGGGTGASSFLGALTGGFVEGITKTQEFQRVMMNIKRSLHEVGRLGFAMGQLFVKAFPGVKQILDGLGDIFDPARFKKLSNAVMGIFKGFSDGSIKSFDELMNKLKSAFFDFFKAGTPGYEKIIAGFKNFFTAVIKIIAGIVVWVADNIEKAVKSLIDSLKNVKGPGAGSFMKMFQPLIDAAIHVFEKLVPLIMPLLLTLGKKIFEVLTTDPFLGFLKKAGPIIALVMFGPSLLKSLTGALTGALTAAATDAVKNAFLGPGSKKISEMSGKEFSKLMSNATPPPGPAPTGSIIPPGTPSPAETANAQATGAMITPGLIIKLLLALAAIITIGLIAFFVASKMVANMDRTQIENALLVLAGVAVAIVPAAFALTLLSGIPATALLAAIPALLALGLVIPNMAMLGVEVAKMVAAVELSSILKALLLILGMSIALIPASMALAQLAGVGGAVAATAPLILVGLLALMILVPAMADLGIELAGKVADIELSSILKALILLGGMSVSLLAASAALAGLAAVGPLAGLVAVAIVGLVAVGLLALAMFELAPTLADAARAISLPLILKSLAILGLMAVGIVAVIGSMALLAVAGVLSIISGVILAGLDAVEEVGVGLIAMARVLVDAGQGFKPSKLGPILVALALMAVTIAEVIPSMILLAAAGALTILTGWIILGMFAVEEVAKALLEAAPRLAEAGAGIDQGAVIKSMVIMALMSTAIAQNIGAMLLLAEAGALIVLTGWIILGMFAVAAVAAALLKAAPRLAEAAKGINQAAVVNAMEIMALMSLAIAQSIGNMLLLVAASPLYVIYKSIKAGLTAVTWTATDLINASIIISKAAAGVSASSVIEAMGMLGLIALQVVKLAGIAILLAALSPLILFWPIIKAGMKVMQWTAEELADKAPSIAESAKKIGATGLAEAMPGIENFSKSLDQFVKIMGAVASLSQLAEGPIKAMDFSWRDSAEGKAKALDSMKGVMDSMMTGVTNILNVVLKMVQEVGASSEALEGAKAISEILVGVGKIAEVLKPSPGFMEAVKAADDDDVKDTMTNGLAGLTTFMNAAGKNIQDILRIIVDSLLPGIAGVSPQQLEAAEHLAPLLEAIGKVVTAIQPPDNVMDAVKEAVSSYTGASSVMSAVSDYMKAMSPVITSLMTNLGRIIPILVKTIQGAGLTPDQIEALKAIGPLIASIGGLVGSMLGPMAELLTKADIDLNDTKEVVKVFKNISKLMSMMEDALSRLLGPGGPMSKLIDLVKTITPENAEAASKLSGIITAVGSLAKGLLPPPEVLKAIQDAASDPVKLASLIGGITIIANLLADTVGKLMGSLSGMISAMSGVSVTPEQVKLMEVLAPILGSTTKLVSDLIANVTKKGPPKAEDLKPLEEFLDKSVSAIKKVFKAMSSTATDMIISVAETIKSLSKTGIKPEALKSGMESLKSAFDIITSVSSVMKDISTMATKSDPKGAATFDAAGFGVLLEKVKELISSIFSKDDSILTKISEGLAKLPPEFGKQKDKIEVLKLTFDMISSMTAVIKGFSTKKGAREKIEIDPAKMAENIASIADIVNKLAGQKAITDLPGNLDKLGALAKQKDNIAGVDTAFKGLGALSKTIKDNKLEDVTGTAIDLKTKTEALGAVFTEISTPLRTLSQAIARVTTDFQTTTLQKSLKELQGVVKAVQNLDSALGSLGSISLQSRMTAIAGTAGLGSAGIYTVKSKDVVVQITLNVTMDAGGVEKAIISNAKSEIRRVVNFHTDNLGKSAEDLSGYDPNFYKNPGAFG
jgi:hypothetical protein